MCKAPWSQVINFNQKGQWPQQRALGHGTIEVLPVWCFSSGTGSQRSASRGSSAIAEPLVYPNVTIGLRYVRVFAIANPSVCRLSVKLVHPTQVFKLSTKFLRHLYLSHPLTSVQNFTAIVPWNPSVGGVKRKRGSKTERCHVRVSHLLMCFLVVQRIQNKSNKIMESEFVYVYGRNKLKANVACVTLHHLNSSSVGLVFVAVLVQSADGV